MIHLNQNEFCRISDDPTNRRSMLLRTTENDLLMENLVENLLFTSETDLLKFPKRKVKNSLRDFLSLKLKKYMLIDRVFTINSL